jgi:hypothetical protein
MNLGVSRAQGADPVLVYFNCIDRRLKPNYPPCNRRLPSRENPIDVTTAASLRARPTPGLYCSATSGMIFPISMAWLGGNS